MGFKGYWFNKIKQKYTTNKYPHCYVGVINKLGGLGVHWGKFDNLYNRESAIFGKFDNIINRVSARFYVLDNVKNRVSARFGSLNEGGNDMVASHTLGLNTDDFMICETENFKMAVENEWHKLEPIELDNSYKLYDADLNELEPTNYGIVIYYKLVVPASLIDGTLSNDFVTSNGVQGFNNAIKLGTPIYIFDTKDADALLFNNIPFEYRLPTGLNETSIPNEDFATGASIASTFINDLTTNKYYVQAASPNTSRPEKFLFYNNITTNNSNYGNRQVRVAFEGTSVTYSIITDGNGLNLPVGDYKLNNANYLMPLLFNPIGLRTAKLNSANQFNNHPELNAWIYCVFGVKEMES